MEAWSYDVLCEAIALRYLESRQSYYQARACVWMITLIKWCIINS